MFYFTRHLTNAIDRLSQGLQEAIGKQTESASKEQAADRKEEQYSVGALRAISDKIQAGNEQAKTSDEQASGQQERLISAQNRTVFWAALAFFAAFAYGAVAFWQGCLMRQTYMEIQKQTVAAQCTAKAAQESANTARDQVELDERPWVFLRGFQLSEEPRSSQKTIVITAGVVNSGRTPALHSDIRTHPRNWDKQPPRVDWSAIANKARPGMIPPGPTGLTVKSFPLTLSEGGLAGYINGKNALYLQARITYADALGHTHWTKICVLHHYGTPLNEFDECETGNDADTIPAKNPDQQNK